MEDFGITEMEEYIEERIQSNIIDSAEDFVVECMKYYIKSHNEVTINHSVEMEIITLEQNRCAIACQGYCTALIFHKKVVTGMSQGSIV